jgi:hypothetical protein
MLTNAQLPHVIAFLLLLARIGDVGSTYLISPALKLEANPIIRRLRWPFAGITILVAAIPYYSVPLGLTLSWRRAPSTTCLGRPVLPTVSALHGDDWRRDLSVLSQYDQSLGSLDRVWICPLCSHYGAVRSARVSAFAKGRHCLGSAGPLVVA